MNSENPLAELLTNNEWYDNSTLELIDSCHRKGFFEKEIKVSRPSKENPEILIETKGLQRSVGHGALIGTCWHGALAKYYGLRPHYPKQTCIYESIRTFARLHRTLIPDDVGIKTKHTLDRNVDVLQMYFDRWRIDDELYTVVEPELAAVVTIAPEPGDPFLFTPFLFVGKADAIFDDSHGNRYILETKTTSGGVDRELLKLKMSRQPRGYSYVFNQFAGEKYIAGVLANVVGILAEDRNIDKLLKRDTFMINKHDLAYWRMETIYKVERWRKMKHDAELADNLFDLLTIFDQRTAECTNFGKCSFYNLCYYGPQSADLSEMPANTWNPLSADIVTEEV